MWLPLLLIAALFETHHLVASSSDSRAMEKMDTMRLLSSYGWDSQQHLVKTKDGYMLRLHRIMGESNAIENDRQTKPKPPVLVQHGILGASDMWVLRGTDKDLPFMLLQAGYDVWLGNVRGNTYCKNHVRLNDTMDNFWNFSFHEMGYYDLPAMIDHILAETGASQLFYIGHSMGTTMFYIMGATRPEYNSKVRAMFSLAPVAFMSEYHPMLKRLAKRRNEIWNVFVQKKIHEVWPRMPWLSATEANLCRDGSPLQSVCVEIVFAITGRDYTQFNKSMLPTLIEHLSSTNPNTLKHFAQNVNSGRFQMYDYGPKLNRKIYGSKEAPDYNLSLITAPVSIHYSTNDYLSYEKDVMRLARQLPNLVGVFKVPYKNFNHIDYLWGNDANVLLYKDIIHLMSKL